MNLEIREEEIDDYFKGQLDSEMLKKFNKN